jgi:CheY-like chemotaxis protein
MEKIEGEAHKLVCEVEDTGQGIAPEDLERIFDPFQQSDAGRSQQNGTGLGLSISREYARMMKGDLTAQSRQGQGSIFRLAVPVMEAASITSEEDLLPAREIIGIAGEKQKFRILVVDDDASNRDLLIRMLSPLSFELQEASGGQEAIDLFKEWSPHLILMDIRMPTMNGLEAIQRIRSRDEGGDTPIIGVSASVFKEDSDRVIEAGADGFIAKPVMKAELLEKIGQCLNIEYQFEERREPSAIEPDKPPLTRERIAELPVALVDKMREAVQGGYMVRLTELAESAADHHPELSRQLIRLVEHYDFDALTELFLEKKLPWVGENGT